MAGMTRDMALVEFVIVHPVGMGDIFQNMSFICLHVKCFTFKGEYNVMG